MATSNPRMSGSDLYYRHELDGQVLAIPPPLRPGDLRNSILTRLEWYTNVLTALPHRSESGDSGNVSAMRLAAAQAALLKDLRQLSKLTADLERRLLARRRGKWLVHASLAILSHAFMIKVLPVFISYLFPAWTTPRARLGPVLSVLQWYAYPIAAYNITNFEKGLGETRNLKRDLTIIETRVENGLEVQDTACFNDATWGGIPWESGYESV
ncbi:hypothetical protein MFIFM68171_08297 [Madurella fahalii]|uniref:Uncharacterized protein n=1 Tax=Madurella fahalii TaxID=1157608 RepID=A0ABQ0GK27_9PEZI